MFSCFGRNKDTFNDSLFNKNVYPPPIILEKPVVIPGFIREGRQLSRALSLDLYSFNDSISIVTDSSIEAVTAYLTNKDDEDFDRNISNEHSYEDNNINSNTNLNIQLIEKPSAINTYLSLDKPTLNNNEFINSNLNLNQELVKETPIQNQYKVQNENIFSKQSNRFSKKKTIRKRVLSAPTETIIHTIDQNSNLEAPIPKNRRHRTPSLKLLAQSVIHLMNKRGSKGRKENMETNQLNNLISDIKYFRSPTSSTISDSKSSISSIQNQNSVGQVGKKQVSFELNLKDRRKSNSIGKKISNLFKRKVSDTYINDNIANNSYPSDDYNQENFPMLTIPVYKLKDIKEYNYPMSSKSSSTESVRSNFSIDQRVASTYDMQIITYDQSAIPVPNVPKGKKLHSVEYFENCYITITPKINNILLSCYNH